MFKRLFSIMAAVVMSVGLASVPAQAAASDCPANVFCIWTGVNGNYTGSRYQYTQAGFTSSNNYTKRLGTGVNNLGTSFKNNTNHSMYLFDAANCGHLNGEWWRTMTIGQQANAAGSDWYRRVSAIGWNIRNDVPC